VVYLVPSVYVLACHATAVNKDGVRLWSIYCIREHTFDTASDTASSHLQVSKSREYEFRFYGRGSSLTTSLAASGISPAVGHTASPEPDSGYLGHSVNSTDQSLAINQKLDGLLALLWSKRQSHERRMPT